MDQKVSIIVPFRNGEEYLERCMEGLLRQTYKNVEILLIDDGSADAGGRLCDDLAGRHPVIRVFHTECRGVSAARNRGLQECTGAYAAFVDVDDYPAEDMIEYLLSLLRQTDCDVAGCGFITFREGEPPQNGKEKPPEVEVLTGMEFIEKGILQSDTRCWSKLYKRESIGNTRFQEGLTIGEDMLFLLELARKGKTFCRSAYSGYGYFMNEKGAMNRSFRNSYMDQITCWQRALESIQKAAPSLADRTVAILLISTMLVVGKLALLPKAERKKKASFFQECSAVIQTYSTNSEAVSLLDRGYKIKIRIYAHTPGLYVYLYHILKSVL